jgi:cellulose biosynthesis protein BcsQ
MPVVTVANLKGGAGKPTAALALATSLAQQGASVIILDCDPNRAIEGWSVDFQCELALAHICCCCGRRFC